MHKATKGDDIGEPGKYSFEVGPSIFEGLDRPSLNPLRILFDALGEKMPVKTYTVRLNAHIHQKGRGGKIEDHPTLLLLLGSHCHICTP